MQGPEGTIVGVTSGGMNDISCYDFQKKEDYGAEPQTVWSVKVHPHIRWIEQQIKDLRGMPQSGVDKTDLKWLQLGGTTDRTVSIPIGDRERFHWKIANQARRVTIGVSGSWRLGGGVKVEVKKDNGEDLCNTQSRGTFAFCVIENPPPGSTVDVNIIPDSNYEFAQAGKLQIVVNTYGPSGR